METYNALATQDLEDSIRRAIEERMKLDPEFGKMFVQGEAEKKGPLDLSTIGAQDGRTTMPPDLTPEVLKAALGETGVKPGDSLTVKTRTGDKTLLVSPVREKAESGSGVYDDTGPVAKKLSVFWKRLGL